MERIQFYSIGDCSVPLSLSLLTEPLWARVLLPAKFLSMDEIEICYHVLNLKPFKCVMINIITFVELQYEELEPI